MAKNFVAEWKKIKLAYENEAGKKKPSEKFLSSLDVISKKSGITAVFKAYEVAFKNFTKTYDADAAKAAFKNLEKGTEAYQVLLWNASVNESKSDLRKCAKDMLISLGNLVEEANKELKTVRFKDHMKLNDFAAIINTPPGDFIKEVARKRACPEIVDFLLLMLKNDRSVKTYNEYIAADSRNELNIASALREKFDEKDLKGAPWDDIINEMLHSFHLNVVMYANQAIKDKLA